MINEILEYEKIWRKKENTKQHSALKQEMYLEFLYQKQIGKDIGVVDRDNFKDIICNEVDRANRKRGRKQTANRRRGRKQKHTDTEIDLEKRRLSGHHFKSNNADSQKNEDGTRESSQETDETRHYRRSNSVYQVH
jgi:hypothetical protein